MKENKVIIREMREEEYIDLVTLWEKSGLPYRERGRDSFNHIKRELKNLNERFLIASLSDKMIGTILTTHDGRKGWINRLAVLPEYRHQGIAQSLVTEAEKWLGSQKILIIACLIENWNKYSFDFFTKMGYIKHDDITYFTKREHSGI